MSENPPTKKKIKLWQLLIAVIVIGVVLAWLLSDYITLP